MRETNLAQARGEYYNLINLTHLFQEVVYAWTLDYVDIVPVILNFDGHNIISLLNRLNRKVRN
jgi:hypothetical protein